MILPDQAAFIAKHFNVYEHNWPFYQELLGEGALIDDALSYCDGAGLYLAAFSLKSPGHSFEPSVIFEYLDKATASFPASRPHFINIWGQFETLPPAYKQPNGVELTLCEQSDYYTDAFDSIFDVNGFDADMPPAAKQRLRALERKNIQTTVRKYDAFTYEHLAIIEQWMCIHNVSAVHKEFFYSLRAYIHKSDVYLCEARFEGGLVGLSVISLVGNQRMVILNSFPLRGNGLRAGDALFAAAISFARERAVRWIHRGYSASGSLLQAKESWGSMTRSQAYREAFYAADAATAQIINDGKFLWRLRLANQQIVQS